MARILPFRGLRYHESQDLSAVTTPPYDIISPSEQDAYYARSERQRDPSGARKGIPGRHAG